MLDQLTGSPAASRYARLADRFNLLGIDPAATSAEVQQAYATAGTQPTAPGSLLTKARDSILDPARRLLCELAYPLDSTVGQVEAFNKGLAANTPTTEFLATANTLLPLSKANFLARVAARQPADAGLLTALVEAHAAIEATTIFENMREYRCRSGFAMPSLMEIRQALQKLLGLQSEAVMSSYDKIQYATRPLQDCVRQVLSNHDRYRVEALSALLNAYRKSLDALILDGSHDINAACEAVKQRPQDESAIKQFETALTSLMLPLAPLMLFDAHQKLRNDEVDRVAARTRGLLADLIAGGDHETVRKIVPVCLGAFGPMPEVVGPFEEAANTLRILALETKTRPSEGLIQNLGDEPTAFVTAMQKGSFGHNSSEPTKTKGSRTASHLKTVFFITVVAVVMCAAFLTFGHLDLPSSRVAASPPPAALKPEPEAIPPVSKGERFKLDFVRYCHFQEERLRVIKQHVRGVEDIQAFNMLANDYNSRCSNFYYQDEDLIIVTEEVKAKKQVLEADAMRILSTWPWHAAARHASPPGKD